MRSLAYNDGGNPKYELALKLIMIETYFVANHAVRRIGPSVVAAISLISFTAVGILFPIEATETSTHDIVPKKAVLSTNFTVRGTFKMRGSDNRNFNIEFQRRGDKWHYITMENGAYRMIGHSEISFDGKDIYYLNYHNKVPFQQLPYSPNKVQLAGKVVNNSDRLPFDTGHWAQFAINPFISDLFDHDVRNQKISARFAHDFEESIMFNANYKFLKTLGLIETIQAISPGKLFRGNGDAVMDLPPPFNNGFKSFEYEMLESTNYLNNAIPLKFQWSAFLLILGGKLITGKTNSTSKSNSLEKLYSASVNIDFVSWNSITNTLLPNVPAPAAVHDYRMLALIGESAPYYTTNGWWHPKQEQFSKYANTRRSSILLNESAIKFNSWKVLILGVFVCLSCIYSIIFWRVFNSHSKGSTCVETNEDKL